MHFIAISLISALLEVVEGAGGSRPSPTGLGGPRPNPTAFGGSPPSPIGFMGSLPSPAGFGGSRPNPTGFGGSRPNPTGFGGSLPSPTGFGGSPPNPVGNGGPPPGAPDPSTCPPVWGAVAANLMSKFVDSTGAPTDDARAAVRLSFHDCFPGACDGSIILSDECTTRPENAQMVSICSTLGAVAKQYNVSVADTVQLGTALGIVTALGPVVSFKVGRKDSNTANPPNQIPRPTDSADSLIANFTAKGFTSTDLVALVGAHSAGKNLSGVAFDTTVNRLDTAFYSETLNGTAPTSLESDINLSKSSGTSATWKGFAASLNGWQAAFVPAMEKMSVLGNDKSTLIDCSSLIKKRAL